MSRIYTKAGDAGDTGYLGKGRIGKESPRIEAIGSLDEANAALGMALSHEEFSPHVRKLLNRIQRGLFEAGAAAADANANAGSSWLKQETSWLESTIDDTSNSLAPLQNFILPGGTSAGATLHWARTASRRAERSVVAAFSAEPERSSLLAYMNRLSDLLFELARRVNQDAGVPETPWTSAQKKGNE